MPTEPAHPMHVSRLSITAALAGCALFLVLVLFLTRSPSPVAPELANVPKDEQWRYTDAGRAAKLDQIHANEQAMATTYGWVDKGKGVVRLPIDRAMELTLADLRAQQTKTN